MKYFFARCIHPLTVISVLTITFGAKITTNFVDKLPRNFETLRSAKPRPRHSFRPSGYFHQGTIVLLLLLLLLIYLFRMPHTNSFLCSAGKRQWTWTFKICSNRNTSIDPYTLNLARCSDCRNFPPWESILLKLSKKSNWFSPIDTMDTISLVCFTMNHLGLVAIFNVLITFPLRTCIEPSLEQDKPWNDPFLCIRRTYNHTTFRRN